MTTVEKIVEIIGDYREEDIRLGYNTRIDCEHVNKWLTQFNKSDRDFLAEQLHYMLPKTYLNKKKFLSIMATTLEKISINLGYKEISDFLNETRFLNCNQMGSSQKEFLKLMDVFLREKYNRPISSCGTKGVKFWYYMDDILASGATFYNNIKLEISKFGNEKFMKSDIKIISAYVILHTWGVRNIKYKIKSEMNSTIAKKIVFYRKIDIQNDPRLYFNRNPIFNHIYPLHSEIGDQVLEFIEDTINCQYDFRNEEYAFRNKQYPRKEKFFSSTENRIRYENILLKKRFEIMQKIKSAPAGSLRPLGMTNPSNKTLGTGTHFFTWRNISNTCPLAFWWDINGWHPLFPRKMGRLNLF